MLGKLDLPGECGLEGPDQLLEGWAPCDLGRSHALQESPIQPCHDEFDPRGRVQINVFPHNGKYELAIPVCGIQLLLAIFTLQCRAVSLGWVLYMYTLQCGPTSLA